MQSYHLSQWILFFFLYSFAGWIWESCYVSVRKRRWVNRGFMHGPMLPIYGSGAIVVLISTIGVRENTGLMFLMGMLGATVLEYITGAVMERIFHVRYWDYSNQKLNVNGYICVSSSLCWGCFSVLLVKVIHVPVEEFVLDIPLAVSEWAAFLLSVVAAVDLTQSFNEAMDMKRILVQLEESREQMRRMQEKIKTVSEERMEEYRQRAEEFVESYRQRSEELIDEYRRKTQEQESEKRSRKAAYLERLNLRREEYRQQLSLLAERAEQLMKEEIPSRMDELAGRERRERQKKELEAVKQSVLREIQKMGERTDRSYLRAVGQLRRNPTAASRKFKEALEDIKKILDNNK